MNWLAHLVLSEPSSAFRVGNLLPDLLSAPEMEALPAKFHRGMACHLAIDRFTDTHSIFRQSICRIDPAFRRYGGILIDIFYDHFLAIEWSEYATIPLARLTAETYAAFDTHRDELPPRAYHRLTQIKDGDWLSAYGEFGGVRRTLDGIGSRLRKPRALGEATAQLQLHYAAFGRDFAEFYPLLRAHVAGEAWRWGGER